MADTALLSGDARLLTLKIAAPGVTAMLASSACQLFEALVLAQNDTPLSAAVGACLALILLEQTVGFTLGMGAGSFVSRCIGQSSVRHTSSSARQSHREAAGRAAGAAFFSALLLSGLLQSVPYCSASFRCTLSRRCFLPVNSTRTESPSSLCCLKTMFMVAQDFLNCKYQIKKFQNRS